MKVNGPGGAGPVGATGAKKPAAGGFTLDGVTGPRETATANAAGAVSATTLDALIALQGAPDALERRRRAVKRAGRLLDVLDEVKLSMLEGANAAGVLERLRQAVREQREGVDDPRLAGVLDEIETRAAVELAKQEAARTRA